MSVVELDKLSWPEILAERDAGRDTVVVAFGATEQHGPHMPLAVDALLGDHLALLVAERLNAFVAPTVRIGCSSHHLDFAGTLSLQETTFHAIVDDIVSSLARGGFRRVVLLPTHGGNFGPLGDAVKKLPEDVGIEVSAVSDLDAILQIGAIGEREYQVPLGEGGLHAGEWETSMVLAMRPELVHLERGAPGYTGDAQSAIERMFSGGVKGVSENGIVGDPTRASTEHGERYWQALVEIALEQLGES